MKKTNFLIFIIFVMILNTSQTTFDRRLVTYLDYLNEDYNSYNDNHKLLIKWSADDLTLPENEDTINGITDWKVTQYINGSNVVTIKFNSNNILLKRYAKYIPDKDLNLNISSQYAYIVWTDEEINLDCSSNSYTLVVYLKIFRNRDHADWYGESQLNVNDVAWASYYYSSGSTVNSLNRNGFDSGGVPELDSSEPTIEFKDIFDGSVNYSTLCP